MARVAVVTGGTRGIGAAISKALKAAGHKVAATYGGNDEAANKFKSDTGIAVYKWDVADAKSCADGLAKVAADLGPVEILVNNAGITKDGVFHRMSWDNWSAVIRTNLDSMFTMTRPLIEGMRERNFGRVINISSINGQKGQFGQANYSAAKAGVIGFTKALASEFAAQGITVNCISPGKIGGERSATSGRGLQKPTPVGREGVPEDVAAVARMLCQPSTGYITGQTIHVNGGLYMP
jgi:acetoacetyl-CoA reductase